MQRAQSKSLNRHGGDGGFTLIEVMIVVAVIGILTLIAFPSYTQYVLRANRSQAQQFMLQIASRQEQYRLDARSYASTLTMLNLTQPAETSSRYTFSIANNAAPPAATTYTITATATGAQLRDKDQRNNKEIRTLTLDNLSTKGTAYADSSSLAGWPER